MKTVIIISVIILIIFLAIFCYYQNNKLDKTYYNLNYKFKDETKIIHLSDFHSKAPKNVLAVLNEEKPNIICITGDFINDKEKNKDKMLIFAKELVKIAPVAYITGNHERRLENYNKLMNELKTAGFNVLIDECIDINNISFLGLDENQADFKDYKERKKGNFNYKDVSKLINDFCSSDKYKIVLSHYPENFEKIREMSYKQYNFDLQLSGHAHGGQWNLPFLGPIFSPGQGLFPKYAKGSFGDKPKLIVSRGIGNSEFPLRLFNHPEIIIINLKK